MSRSSQVVVVSSWAFFALLLGCVTELLFVFLCLVYVPPSSVQARSFLAGVVSTWHDSCLTGVFCPK